VIHNFVTIQTHPYFCELFIDDVFNLTTTKLSLLMP